jgi:peptidyl-dipeptidase Dcp
MSEQTDNASTVKTTPLLQEWSTPYGLPPFAQVRPEHVGPALGAAMAEHREQLARIATSRAAPDFDNTVAAFDRAGRRLGRVAAAFYSLTASATSPALQAVQRDMAGPMAAHGSAVYTDAGLFAASRGCSTDGASSA